MHQSARTGVADRVVGELTFLAGNRVDHGPVGAGRRDQRRKAERGEARKAVGIRSVGKDYRKIAPADVARQLRHEDAAVQGVGLIGDLAVEADADAPRRVTGDFGHSLGQRLAEESGAFGIGGGRLGRRADRQGPAEPLERELAVEPVGILRRHLEIALPIGLVAGLLRGDTGPIQALGLGRRRSRGGGVAIEQGRRTGRIAELPQRACGAEPHQ